MQYILNLPNYRGPFSLIHDGQRYSLPQSSTSAELDEETWKKLKGLKEIKELQDNGLLLISNAPPQQATSEEDTTVKKTRSQS